MTRTLGLQVAAVLGLTTATFAGTSGVPCPGDIDQNGDVAFSDLVEVLANWGPCPGCAADVTGDDEVGFDDLLEVLTGWGACTELRLTILHNNDGESQLINAGTGLEDFGGIARFTTLVNDLRAAATAGGGSTGVLMLSSGDNFLAGPEFAASLDAGVPFYDSLGLDAIGYDAMCIGNHEFDFGPEILADFIEGFSQPTGFLSANLDYALEPDLAALVGDGTDGMPFLASSTVINVAGHDVGIVGATTEDLPFISSPRDVLINAVVPSVQAEVDALLGAGVNKIILISHLQSVNEDLDVLSMLTGVDVAIAGGGDELLANPSDVLVPGDEGSVFGPYPLVGMDMLGNEIPVITTSGNYKYVGRLVVDFDAMGNLISIDSGSGPVRVAGGSEPDAVLPDPAVQATVVDPVIDAIADLAATIIGSSDVALDGRRPEVRTRETNEGNLCADSLLWQASQLATSFGALAPDVALQNGGGIRNDAIISAGSLTALDTFDILPFSNFVCIVPDISRAQFKEILENAVSQVENTSGRFAQVAGFSFEFDPAGTAQELDADGNVVVAGTRVLEVVLDDATVIVTGGVVQPGADLVIATIDFLARGGDQYPYRGASFTSVGVSYQQALRNYIEVGLGGSVTAVDYPLGGEGRITETP